MERIEFTKEMRKTHTILIPIMLPIHFQFLRNFLTEEGYHVDLLQTQGQQIIDEGLKNVHNDTCYPALLVIGQMIDALKSGKYDIDHVALAITQTGGGCRASNYIHLLRKALIQAGFPQVPVISVNFSKLEKNSGFQLTPKFMIKLIAAFLYADTLMWLKNQCLPYEIEKGDTQQKVNYWIKELTRQMTSLSFLQIKKNYHSIVADFASIIRCDTAKIKVGIVGEIYMKYAPLGNNDLEAFLIQEGCEPVVSGVMDFGLYCLKNTITDYEYYYRNKKLYHVIKLAIKYITHLQNYAIKAIQAEGSFAVPETFEEIVESSDEVINRGNKMGEGWLLTSEMVSLIKSGVDNIVCCQPFGCLPNHIVAKGMMRKIKRLYPQSNIVAVDYDPSATRVNQENRLKLMLSNARLNEEYKKQERVQANGKAERKTTYAYTQQ